MGSEQKREALGTLCQGGGWVASVPMGTPLQQGQGWGDGAAGS